MKSKNLQWSEWLKLREELFSSSARFMQSVNKLDPTIREKIMEKSEWSPKDVLSHIVGWDIEVVNKFNEFLINPDADDEYDIDTFNKKAVRERKETSWDNVMNEFKTTQSYLSDIINKLTADNIRSDSRFVEWVKVLTEHYDHHRIKLEKLLHE